MFKLFYRLEQLQRPKGFTLVELLVVMAIIGILAALVVGNFRTTQLKARDAQRKSDLKQLAASLELYFNDYGRYPASAGTLIAGCPTTTQTACSWGSGTFTDGQTTYMKTMVRDPSGSWDYVYQASSDGQKFRIFTRLENEQDPDIVSDLSVLCGSLSCNFGISSTNANLTETF